ncbi:myelin-associated glycoprotein-like isoform X2 [Neoarius graeffei]|nr:myelin-associated glycoprotein-like isoform X2 [Neoarius graeffei]
MDLQSKILFIWICLQVICASVFSDVWKVEVDPKMEALVSSCVVLSCKFNYPGDQLPTSRIRGIWHKRDNRDARIFDEDPLKILDSFKDRTKLIGRLGDRNCSLEINDVKDHDNGPFCFRTELEGQDKYSFVENCVNMEMKSQPDKPNLELDESIIEKTPTTFKCSIRHTCPTHHPTIKWSLQGATNKMFYKKLGHGVWEVESLLTIIATKEDDHKDITCTVTFHGELKSEVSRKIYIKRKEDSLHIIIPVCAVLGTIVVFGITCFFVTKRYKSQIQELQSRNPNGAWSRLSRFSHRVRSVEWLRNTRNTAGLTQN